ncbi:MAG: hypothetical protein RL172_1303 [Bacteroidota bacterium]|jgi:ABC-type multidrug transport system ATPase subunit
MNITLTNTGKRFNREWIFRGLNYQFNAGGKYAITGPNGSGKSTLLQVIAGATMHSEGSISYTQSQPPHQEAAPYLHLSIAAPYLDLIEEMTALELLHFHSAFKPLSKPHPQILQAINLSKAANKQIRYYSSGMKQRLKLAQAFYSATPILLLDEPTTNLDAEGIALYQQLIQEQTSNRLVIISSNDAQEYAGCDAVLHIADYKTSH